MDRFEFEPFDTPERAREHLQSLVDGADDELLLSISRSVLEDVQAELEAAIERDVLVLLLIGGSESEPPADIAFDDVASVVHYWEGAPSMPVVCTADHRDGLVALEHVFRGTGNADQAIRFRHLMLRTYVFSTVIGNTWNRAPEIFTTDPDPLPRTYDTFPKSVVNAALHLQAGQEVVATISGELVSSRESTTVEGRVVNVRQSFVSPITSTFPIENSLFVRVEDDLISVGGPGAFVEDVEAHEVTLRPG